MRHPIIRISIACLLAFLILVISSIFLMTVSRQSNLFINVPFIEKTFLHTSMLFFSIMVILILGKGKMVGYGFIWSMDFPFIRIVLLSVMLGFISSLVINLFFHTSVATPGANFSFPEKIMYIWVWASICEEVLTRGLIMGFLAPLKHYGIKLSGIFISLPVIVAALFFGAMHLMLLSLGASLFTVLNIVVFGIILGLIAGYYKERSNSLLPAVIVHICFNVGASFLAFV